MQEIKYIIELSFVEGIVWFPMVLCIGVIYQYLKTIDVAIDGVVIMSSILFTLTYNTLNSILISYLVTLLSIYIIYITIGFLIAKLKVNSILVGIIISLILHSISVLLVGESIKLNYESIVFLQKPIAIYLIAIFLLGLYTLFERTYLGIKIKAVNDSKYFNGSVKKTRAIIIVYLIAATSLSVGVLIYTTRLGSSRAGGGFDFLITTLCSYLFIDKIILLLSKLFKGRIIVLFSFIQSPVIKALIGSILFQFLVTTIIFYTNNPIYWKLVFGLILFFLIVNFPLKRAKKEPAQKDRKFEKGILIDNISFIYKDGFSNNLIFSNFTLHLKPGINIVWGNNGAGKSTLLNLIRGNIQPDSGTIYYNGLKINEEIKNKTFSFYQNPFDAISSESTVFENLLAVKNISGRKLFSIPRQSCSIPSLDKNQKGSSLSGGQAQKLCMLLCKNANPEIIIADEPTSGLDDKSFLEFESFLKTEINQDVIIIIVTHDNRFNSFNATNFKLTPNEARNTK